VAIGLRIEVWRILGGAKFNKYEWIAVERIDPKRFAIWCVANRKNLSTFSIKSSTDGEFQKCAGVLPFEKARK
jgi:hypothetical protein